MQSKIWASSNTKIHLVHRGTELEFESLTEFMESLLLWQEFALTQQFIVELGETELGELWDGLNQDRMN